MIYTPEDVSYCGYCKQNFETTVYFCPQCKSNLIFYDKGLFSKVYADMKWQRHNNQIKPMLNRPPIKRLD